MAQAIRGAVFAADRREDPEGVTLLLGAASKMNMTRWMPAYIVWRFESDDRRD